MQQPLLYMSISVFYWKSKYSKCLNGTQLRDILGTKWWDFLGTSVEHDFKIQVTNILNWIWQVIPDLLAKCSCKKFSEQYSGKKNSLAEHVYITWVWKADTWQRELVWAIFERLYFHEITAHLNFKYCDCIE